MNRNSLFPDEWDFLHLLKGSELNFILHWKAYSLIFSRSWLRSFAEVSMSWTTENKDVPPANSFHLLLISFDKSLIYIKKQQRFQNRSFWYISVSISPSQNNFLKTTFSKRLFAFLLLSSKLLIISLQIPLWRSLKISPSCHILSKTFEKSRNIPQT